MVVRVVEGSPQQPVPEAEEQGEVHIARGAVLHVVKAVHGRPGEEVAQPADAHVDIAVLEQELDGNGEGQQRRYLRRYAEDQQRRDRGDGFHGQVQRVFHQAVETVQAPHAVMDRMQAPEPGQAVAQQVHEGQPQVRHHHAHQQLQPQGPGMGPEAGVREQGGQQGNGQQAEGAQPFVDHGMQGVAPAVVMVLVPVRAVGQPGFD
ncbi:hypothetical protein D9M70_532040 [compost metagenome]